VGVIYVPDPATGRPQPIQISGATPTPTEQQRLDQWIASRQPVAAPAPPPVEAPDDNPEGTAFGRGLFSGGWRTAIGSTLEGVGIDSLGGALMESGERAAQEADLMGISDIDGLGSLGSFTGEALGSSAGISGQTLAGAGAGALAGAPLGPLGMLAGGALGGAAAAFPIFYGQNREAQKEADLEAGRPIEVDEGTAALMAIPQAALDAILGAATFGVGRVPAGILTRVVKDASSGAVIEVPTEVGQQVLEDVQAGRDITSEDALLRYRDAAIAGGLVGGTVGGATAPFSSRTPAGQALVKTSQIERDLKEDEERAAQQQEYAMAVADLADKELAEQNAIAMQLPGIREQQQAEREEAEARVQELRAALKESAERREAERVASDRRAHDARILAEDTKKDAMLQRQAAIAADNAAAEAERRRGLAKGAKAQHEAMKAAQDNAAEAAVKRNLQRIEREKQEEAARLERIAKNQEKLAKETKEAEQAAKRATKRPKPEAAKDIEEAGPTEIEPVGFSPSQITSRAVRGKATADYGTDMKSIQVVDSPNGEYVIEKVDGAGTPYPTGFYVRHVDDPTSEAVYIADRQKDAVEEVKTSLSRNGDITTFSEMTTGRVPPTKQARQRRSIAQEADAAADSLWAPKRKSQISRVRQAGRSRVVSAPPGIVQSLRQGLDQVGLKDVGLSMMGVIDNDAAIEGAEYTQHEKGMIALALDIYDPNLSDTELGARLADVLNHEIIHSLRTLDLFKPGEFSALIKAAATQNKVGRDGNLRKYTYLEYETAKNERLPEADRLTPSQVMEEAVAEMFRDYASGRLKLSGRPKNIWQRIVRFLKGLAVGAQDAGVTDAASIFADIQSGAIGARERGPLLDRGAQTNYSTASREGAINDGRREVGYASGGLAPLEGAPNVRGASGPDAALVQAAERYAREQGIPLARQAEFVEVDPERASRIADAYEQMPHDPTDPKVREAYDDLIRQTMDQYQTLVDEGYSFTFFDEASDPYDGNPWNAMRDLRANKSMAVYGTYDGYGTDGITADAELDNPLLVDTGLRWPDQSGREQVVTANDLFRAVHDAFGHGIEGAGFRARGEENAWQAHSRLFYGPALAALTTETRGQNSWLNYGPYGEQNRTASVEDTVFAPQKAGLMPEWTWAEGRAGDMRYSRTGGSSPMQIGSAYVKKVGVDPGVSANPDLVAGMDLLGPKNIEAASKLIKSYNLMPVTSRSPARIVEEFIEHVRENLMDVYNRIPPEVQEETKLWYEGARRITSEFADRFGVPDHVVAAMIARTSPKSDWHVNVARVERMLDILTNGRDIVLDPKIRAVMESNPHLAQSIDAVQGRTFGEMLDAASRNPDVYYDLVHFMRGIDETYNPTQTRQSDSRGRWLEDTSQTFSWMETKFLGDALRIYNNQDLNSISELIGQQHKVRSFYNNILAPNDPRGNATIDTHAVAVGIVKPIGAQSIEAVHNFNAPGVNNRTQGSVGMYPVYLEAYRRAAEQAGRLPREMQSITWEGARSLMPAGGKTKAFKSFADEQWASYKNGRQTRKETVDAILERAGGSTEPNWWRHRIGEDDQGAGSSYESGISEAERRDGGDGLGGTPRRDGGDVPSDGVAKRYSKPAAVTSGPLASAEVRAEREIAVEHGAVQRNVAKVFGYLISPTDAERISSRFFTLTQDAFLPVGKVIDELRAGNITIPEVYDTYVQEKLKHGRVGAAMDRNRENLFEPALIGLKGLDVNDAQMDSLKRVSGYAAAREDQGIADIPGWKKRVGKKPSRSMIVADAYLYALHAKERNAYGETVLDTKDASGMTDAEADAIIAWVNALPTEQKTRLNELRANVKKIVQDTNKRRVESGLIPEGFTDPQEVDGETVYDNRVFTDYIPLQGKRGEDMELDENTKTAARRQLTGREDRVMRGRRGVYAGQSPLMMVMVQNSQAINRAETNRVIRSFADLIAREPEAMQDIATLTDKGPRSPTDERYVGYKVDGEQKWIVVERPSVARAFDKGLSPASLGKLSGFMYSLNRMLSQLITTYSPEFLLTNFPRDVATALVNASQYEVDSIAKGIGKSMWPSLKAVRDYTIQNKRSDAPLDWSVRAAEATPEQLIARYQEFIDAGGKQLVNELSDLSSARQKIDKIMADAGVDGDRTHAGKVLRFAQDGMENLNEVGENMSRFAFYMAMRENGLTATSAASAARDLTTNFSKKGEWGSIMGAYSMFYNASLQGSMALVTAAARSKRVRKALGGLVAAGFLSDMVLGALSEEDEDGVKYYDKLQDYEKEHNIFIPTFDGGYISIPLAYGLNNFWNMGRATSAVIRGAMSPARAVNSVAGTMLEIINPMGDDHDMLALVSPTILDPYVALASNEDFTGRAIFKEGMPGQVETSSAYQHWNTTSPTFQAITQAVNDMTGGNEVVPGAIDFSPDVAEYLFNYYTGGLGRFISRTLDAPWTIMQPIAQGSWDGETIEATPMLRRLYTMPSTRGDLGFFLERFDVVRLARKEYQTAVEAGDRQWASRVREEKGHLLKKYMAANAVNGARRKLARLREAVLASDMPEEQKTERLQKIADQERKVVSRGIELLKDINP